MTQLSTLIQSEFQAVYEAIAQLQFEIQELREARNRTIMVGERIRVEGNRCELGFGRENGEWRQRSGLVPWLERAGEDYQTFMPPSVGEQGLLLNFGEADSLSAGVAVFGVRSNKNPLPTLDANQLAFNFKDGIEILIDREQSTAKLNFSTDELSIVVPQSIKIDASNVVVTGKLTANDIESKSEVKDSKRTMGNIVESYNQHTHSNNGSAPPSTLIP